MISPSHAIGIKNNLMEDEKKPSAVSADGVGTKRTIVGDFVSGLNALGTLIIVLLMVLINTDVILRNAINSPIPGVIELTETGIVILVFLQVGHTLRVNRFMRSNGLIDLIAAKKPKVGHAMNFTFNIVGAFLFALIVYSVRSRFIDAWNGDYYIGVQGAFTFPVWPSELAILIGSAAMVTQFMAFAFGHLKSLIWSEQK